MMFNTEAESVGGAAHDTQRKIAKHIRNLFNFRGSAALYRMSPPHAGHEFVIASAVNCGFAHETYLFPATPDGEIADWIELDGSERNTTSHERVMSNIDYVIEY